LGFAFFFSPTESVTSYSAVHIVSFIRRIFVFIIANVLNISYLLSTGVQGVQVEEIYDLQKPIEG